jgi:hypothetical protein
MTTVTSSQPRQFNRLTNDVAVDNAQSARFIGYLKPGESRITLVSQIVAKDKDKTDNFYFTMTKAGTAGLSLDADPDVRVELVNKQGRVLADSAASDGSALKTAYDNLQSSKMDLARGDYYVRVSRNSGSSRSENLSYNLQFNAGLTGAKYKEDYTTVEAGQKASSTVRSGTLDANAMNALTDTMTNSSGFVNIFA